MKDVLLLSGMSMNPMKPLKARLHIFLLDVL